MSNPYESVHGLPLKEVLEFLGFTQDWKPDTNSLDLHGVCPICLARDDQASFTLASDGTWHCAACNASGNGALDLVIAVKKLSLSAAVELLQGQIGNIMALQAKRPALQQVQALGRRKEFSEDPNTDPRNPPRSASR